MSIIFNSGFINNGGSMKEETSNFPHESLFLNLYFSFWKLFFRRKLHR